MSGPEQGNLDPEKERQLRAALGLPATPESKANVASAAGDQLEGTSISAKAKPKESAPQLTQKDKDKQIMQTLFESTKGDPQKIVEKCLNMTKVPDDLAKALPGLPELRNNLRGKGPELTRSTINEYCRNNLSIAKNLQTLQNIQKSG